MGGAMEHQCVIFGEFDCHLSHGGFMGQGVYEPESGFFNAETRDCAGNALWAGTISQNGVTDIEKSYPTHTWLYLGNIADRQKDSITIKGAVIHPKSCISIGTFILIIKWNNAELLQETAREPEVISAFKHDNKISYR